MKKVLAFILAFVLVFINITIIFADGSEASTDEATVAAQEDEISDDAKTCRALGIITGDDKGVTPEYLRQEVTKLTTAIAVLKLRGLYDEATAFTGTDTFADIKEDASAEIKSIMAYLKSNPELGFKGDEKNNFNPAEGVREQFYYKFLLEALGYKQSVEDEAGDFTLESTLEFAEKVGLWPMGIEKSTMDDFASAIVQALSANTKEGKVYVDIIIAKGKLTREEAEKAGISEATLRSAYAINNNYVKVRFNGAIGKDVASMISNYSIEGLTVKSVKWFRNGSNIVVIETSPQTVGKLYTLKIGEDDAIFTGISALGANPKVLGIEYDDETGKIRIYFDRMLESGSAENMDNYLIKDATVESAEYDADMDEVQLTVKGLVQRRYYEVKISNIKAMDGNVLKPNTRCKLFYTSDIVPPKVKSLTVDTNKRIILEFSENVTEESASNIENYTIKSDAGVLAIKNIDYYNSMIEIETEPQESIKYEFALNNIADKTANANKMVKGYKTSFIGKKKNTVAPKLHGFEYIARNTAKVEFSSPCRLDEDSLLDPENYIFDNDIAVESLETIDTDEYKSVALTISPVSLNKAYKLTVKGVKDEFGNEIKETSMRKMVTEDAISASTITDITDFSDDFYNYIQVKFTKELNRASTENLANYWFDGGLGHPTDAEYSSTAISDDYKLNLYTAAPMVPGKKYKLNIEGLEDLAGNTINKEGIPFVAGIMEDQMSAAEIIDVTAVNKNVVRVEFDKSIANIGTAAIEIKRTDNSGNPIGAAITLLSKVGYEDDKIVEFSDYPAKKLDVAAYMITGLNVTNKAGKRYELPDRDSDKVMFEGTAEKPEGAELLSVYQVDAKKFELTFNEKVKALSAKFVGLAPSVRASNKTSAYLKSSSVIRQNKTYDADLGKSFVNMHGIPVKNLEDQATTEIVSSLDDTEAPYIEKIEAIDRNTVKLIYNEGLVSLGAYEIEYCNSAGKKIIIKSAVRKDDNEENDNIVLLMLDKILESVNYYTLRVKSAPIDYAGVKADNVGEEYSFAGTDNAEDENRIIGVDCLDERKIRVNFLKAFDKDEEIAVDYFTDRNTNEDIFDSSPENIPAYDDSGKDRSSVVVYSTQALARGIYYDISVNGFDTYFEGGVDDGLEIEENKTSGSYVFIYSHIEAGDIVTAAVYGIVNGKLDGLNSIKIRPDSNENFILPSNGKLILRAHLIAKDASTKAAYEDADLRDIISAVKDAYDAKSIADPTEEEKKEAIDLEEAAIELIEEYDGAGKVELLKLLNAAQNRLN